jgi:hypothetical protein
MSEKIAHGSSKLKERSTSFKQNAMSYDHILTLEVDYIITESFARLITEVYAQSRLHH